MSAVQPLSHHEILGLVEPFTRRGRHLDLASSQRLERRLAFKPRLHAGAGPDGGDLVEALRLENTKSGKFRLTRSLMLPGGLEASLQVDGPDAGALLATLEAIPLQRQYRQGDGYLLALCQQLSAGSGWLTLTRAEAEVAGLKLKARVPIVPGVLAEIELLPAAGEVIDLPDDLLAVLGWSWARLQRVKQGWTCVLRLRGKDAARSRDAEAKLQITLEHLARTLHEPPARFHERMARRRWGVTLRRAMPALGGIALIAGAAAVPKIDLAEDSVLRMLIFHAPPLLLVVFFCMREMPRIEIPPRPRPSNASSWRVLPGDPCSPTR